MSQIYDEADSAYATACSDVTICSNNKGFFKQLSDEIMSIADTDGWINTFEKLDDTRKVSAVMENSMITDTLEEVFSRITPLFRGKDARVSYEKRLAAQAALKDGDLTKSLALASQAVLRAPMTGVEEVIDGGVSLALALWVRSDILLKLNKYKAALVDLKLALKERLPAKIKAQYYWRMGHCYRGAEEPSRAKVSYELARRLLSNDENSIKQLNSDINSLECSVQTKLNPEKKAILLTGGAKLNVPTLSNLVKVIEEERKGRYVIANKAVQTGDVLLIDKPYAACLISDYYGSHCLHCFKRLESCVDEAPIWCTNCSGVAFCSVECRDKAVSSYHLHECKFIDLFVGSGMSVLSHIALRMVTQAGLETSLSIHSSYISNQLKVIEGTVLNDIEGNEKRSKMKSRKERLNRSKKYLKSFEDKNNNNCEEVVKNNEDNTSYHDHLEMTAAQIYSLCTHSQLRKGSDYLKRIVMSMFLTECLKKGGFFNKLNKEDSAKAQISICELIVRNLQLLQFNAHEIYETVRGKHLFTGSKPVYIAVGIYPTGALFNHECYPAVARYFDGRNIILRAIRPLSPGETVSENYGPHFLIRNLRERQRALACRYWFKCECIACREEWPLLKQMRDDLPPYLRCSSPSCSGKFQASLKCLPNKCSKCSSPIDENLVKNNLLIIDKCSADYQEGAKLMEKECILEATSTLCAAVDSLHEIGRPPHRETHLAQESLRTLFAAMGNTYRVQIND
ncbi:SET and MYND domain-containing protein 4 [Leptidea sinapis]|uniref:SET and MYND domain-containing protein 4 n=1 Tax=Leptidea sinapis TaxID=189913 RepID=UPI002139A26E|nr:SET and MYND domain-containing protein 4 [Leptidea sinapis]